MLPSITHLQFAVLRVIRKSECSGSWIRLRLKHKISDPGFYQAMARLEKEKYVTKRYQMVSRKRIAVYKITMILFWNSMEWHNALVLISPG